MREALARAISEALGRRFTATAERPAGGGCINRAVILEGAAERFFVKLNDAARLELDATVRERADDRAVIGLRQS